MLVDRAQIAAALPGYELGDQIGSGGFGLVLAGWQTSLQRDVAIKVLAAGSNSRSEAAASAEARILAGLDHPHIVRVFDYREAEGLRLIVMERLAGGTLAERGAELGPDGVCAVGLAVADALSCAHGKGVLHRDIKPDNVMFDASGLLKVVDFGIAKLVGATPVTASAVVGTPLFMAPEQVAGGRIGPATDLYGLAMVLHNLLTGYPGHPGGPDRLAEAETRAAGLPSPSLLQPGLVPPSRSSPWSAPEPLPAARPIMPGPLPVEVPASVGEVVFAALAADPADRPDSAHVFALALARAAADAYGPAWIARSGIPIRLRDDVRAVAERPSRLHWVSLPKSEAPEPPSESVRGGAGAANPPQPPVSAAGRSAPGPDPGSGLGSGLGSELGSESGRPAPAPVVPRSASARLRSASAKPPAGSPSPPRTPMAPAGRGMDNAAAAAAAAAGGGVGARRRAGARARRRRISRRWAVRGAASAAAVGLVVTGVLLLLGAGERGGGSGPQAVRPVGSPLTGHTNWVAALAFAPDGHTMASGSKDGTVRLWDVRDPEHPRFLASTSPPTAGVLGVALSPQGGVLALTNWDGTEQLWDVHDPSHPVLLPASFPRSPASLSWVTFNADGQRLIDGTRDGVVRYWDVTDLRRPRLLSRLSAGSSPVDWVRQTVDPLGAYLISSSSDGNNQRVRVWWMTTEPEPSRIGDLPTGHSGPVYGLAMSPDLRTLATGSKDTTIRLWDMTDPSAPHPLGPPLRGHSSSVWSLAFAPNGRLLASGSFDNTVRLWDLSDRSVPRPLGGPLTGHSDFVQAVAFAPDGRLLATGSRDGTIRLWRVPHLPAAQNR